MQAVIFDLDNTLYSYSEVHEIANKALLRKGASLLKIGINEFEEAITIGKKSVKAQVPFQAASHNRLLYIENALEYLGVKPASYALMLYDEYWNTFLKQLKLNEGVLIFLQHLKNCHIKIALCSDLTAHIQYRKLRALEIEEFFDYIITSEEAGIEKPNSIIFKMAINKLKVNPSEVVFIGDDFEKDVLGAAKMGMKSIWFNPSRKVIPDIDVRYKEIKSFVGIEEFI